MVAAIAPRPDSPSPPTTRPRLYVVPGGATIPGWGTPRRRHHHAPSVYRRRRIVVLVALAGVLVGLGLAVRAVADGPVGAPAPSRPIAPRVWVVRPGDTLWAIALASGDKGDIRALVDRLSAQVDGRTLVAGERITLPSS